ncbi:stomatin-like protein stl-1 [Amphiura filiformis]|uniref:stomatin-like protein stl-1 n=1 Tax=Amphiura filiformis TaxID=82378 RepID=UPI003B211E2F
MLASLRNLRTAERILSRSPASTLTSYQVRHSSAKVNTVVLFVPQQEAWVIERMGKFHRVLQPGLNFCMPVLDSIKHIQSLKEIAIAIPEQSAITVDNVTLRIDGVLYLRITDPYKASYGVEDAEYAVTQLAQTTMRSEIGKIALDLVFKERESLNVSIVEAINNAAQGPWGIQCLRYEIKDIGLPKRVQDAMQMQVEAERKKRAVVLESEGIRESEINVAEGKKRAQILSSEAIRTEQINRAEGEANAIIAKANAKADALIRVAGAIGEQYGGNAASLNVAEQYVAAFSNLAKTGNTVLLPSNTGDISSMVGQAMAIYGNMTTQQNAQAALAASSEAHPTEEKFTEGEMVMDKLHEDFQKKLNRRENDLRKHLQKTEDDK